MKKIAICFVFFMFPGLLLYNSSSWPVSADGETLFNSKCGGCHAKGLRGPVFAPVKYASIQWERFFKRNKHKRKEDISGAVSPMELELIKQYLIDHAADSDRPIAAGLK